MCQSLNRTRHLDVSGCVPCDCGCVGPFRRYYSSEEEHGHLETYREQLKKELAGVEERLDRFASRKT
jgi:hypothetical protein